MNANKILISIIALIILIAFALLVVSAASATEERTLEQRVAELEKRIAALEACKRTFDDSAFRAGVKALRRQGISVESDLIIGLPNDTRDDVLAGMRFAVDVDPGASRCRRCTSYRVPTCVLAHQREAGGIHKTEGMIREAV